MRLYRLFYLFKHCLTLSGDGPERLEMDMEDFLYLQNKGLEVEDEKQRRICIYSEFFLD